MTTYGTYSEAAAAECRLRHQMQFGWPGHVTTGWCNITGTYDVVNAPGDWVTPADISSPIITSPNAFTQTFIDDFTGSAIDGTKWTTPPYTGRTNASNNELEWYLDANVTVASSLLSLTAKSQVTVNGGTTYNYSSGAIDTNGKFSQAYGYFESRIKVPSGQGLWPAFWLLPSDHGWPPEIDVMEILGHEPAICYCTYHANDSNGLNTKQSGLVKTSDGTAFHNYGVYWTPAYIAWYLDGVEYYRVFSNITDKPHYLILDLAVGGTWPGSPNGSTVFPAVMQVDWVKAWSAI